MKVKSGVSFLVAGLLVLIVSLGWWTNTRPSPEAGDAVAVERALTSGTDAPAPTLPNTTTGSGPVSAQSPPDATEPPASIPKFTVDRHPEGHNRVPVGIRIPAIGVEAPVSASGVETNGDMQVPENVTDVGWYKHGPAPGESGSAVLAAHVDLASQGRGVFYDLGDLEPGDVILVDFDDGTTETYHAEARTVYEKTELPLDVIFSREGPPVLTLITCGGIFNRSLGRYESNVVVYAVPVGNTATTSMKSPS